MIRSQMQMDWLLKGLVEDVPGARHALVLTADGLRMAHYAVTEDVADRLAAICAGLQSLSAAVAEMFPGADQRTRMIVIEVGGGFFYVMAASEGVFLAVVADDGVDAGLVGRQMRDLVDLPDTVPVVLCDARERPSCRDVLLGLSSYLLELTPDQW